MRRKPDARLETKTLDIRCETVHAAGEAIVDGGPVAILAKAMSGALPTVVDLDLLHTEVFQILSDPFRGDLDLVFVDLLVEKIPGAPAGGRQWKSHLVEGREVFDLERVAVIVVENGAVFQVHLVFRGIESAVGYRRLDVAERHHHQFAIRAIANARRNRMRPRLAQSWFSHEKAQKAQKN